MIIFPEEGTRNEFKRCVHAFLCDTSEWEIEAKLLDSLCDQGVFGSSLGYETDAGWLYITFVVRTAANCEQVVKQRCLRVAPYADCYLDAYHLLREDAFHYKGWIKFKHILSPHVHVLQDKVGFSTPTEIRDFLTLLGQRQDAVYNDH